MQPAYTQATAAAAAATTTTTFLIQCPEEWSDHWRNMWRLKKMIPNWSNFALLASMINDDADDDDEE